MTSSKLLRKLFPGRYQITNKSGEGDICKLTEGKKKSVRGQNPVAFRKVRNQASLLITTLTAPIVWIIVVLSEIWDAKLRLPGFGIACISVLSCIVSNAFSTMYQTLSLRFRKDTTEPIVDTCASIFSEVGKVTSKMSDVCYYMLLAVIGISTSLQSEIYEGGWSSSSSFLFATAPLVVHFVVILLGSLGLMRMFPCFKWFPLGIEEIAVASNAVQLLLQHL